MKTRYRFRLDKGGLGLFFLIMLPNFIWFAMPAPVDVLRQPSVTPCLDQIAAAVQALMVVALCLIRNRQAEGIQMHRPAAVGIGLCCLGYFAVWGCYYGGIVYPAVLISMCFLPCLALLLYTAAQRNWPAFGLAAAFAVLHGIFGICNFLR